jgi:hypothetical protein
MVLNNPRREQLRRELKIDARTKLLLVTASVAMLTKAGAMQSSGYDAGGYGTNKKYLSQGSRLRILFAHNSTGEYCIYGATELPCAAW